METRIAVTRTYQQLAALPCKSRLTHTQRPPNQIHTATVVQARVCCTECHPVLAPGSGETFRAETLIVLSSLLALTTVETGPAGTAGTHHSLAQET